MNQPARALIVDDELAWQQVLAEIFGDAGLLVDVAGSLDSALEMIGHYPYRLAVMDLSLNADDPHNQDGLRVLEMLERRDPACVRMLLTGFATVELAVSVLTDYGAFTCLRKEAFNRAQFRDLIYRALASAPPADSGEAGLEPAPTQSATAAEASAAPLGSALVVEDDAGWRSILHELLVDAGYQVRLCSSFGEALGCLRRENYTLAVIDLSLSSARPGALDWEQPASAEDTEGYHLLESTRAGGIPAIVVSGVASLADIEKTYREKGIFAFMQKQSFERSAFLRTVQEAQSAARPLGDLDVLTEREREVLPLLARGLTNKEIADTLFISTNTVKQHLKAIFEKLDVHTRSAAASKAAEHPSSRKG